MPKLFDELAFLARKLPAEDERDVGGRGLVIITGCRFVHIDHEGGECQSSRRCKIIDAADPSNDSEVLMTIKYKCVGMHTLFYMVTDGEQYIGLSRDPAFLFLDTIIPFPSVRQIKEFVGKM